MTHTLTLSIETGAISPDESVALQTTIIETIRSLHAVRRLTTTAVVTHRGYVVGYSSMEENR
jgi:hypothetical protein